MTGVDERAVAAWVRGWTVARETPPPVDVPGGFRVDVGWPDQRVRYVFPRLTEDVRRVADSVDQPGILLKACAAPDEMRSMLPPRFEIARLGFLMTIDGEMRGAGALADGYALSVDADRAAPLAEVRAADGEVAASGRVALVDGFAIYDRIETHPGHRRRGLARGVMRALEALARERGAERGVLVATGEGRALHESLGWRLDSLYSTAAIPYLTR